MNKLKYFNDKDSWMLGEDIPDLDFFFSQIWLSCFVNEFARPGGKAYKKILGVYCGYHVWFYFGEQDSNKVGQHLVNKFLRSPEFVQKLNREIIYWADRLRSYSKKLPESNLNKFSNKQLWDFYEEHDKIHTEYYTWCWIPVACDMFHANFTEKLKGYLMGLGVSEEKLNEYFVILTQPTKKSLIQIEREEFLNLAAFIKRDAYHSRLFHELFNKFQEQEINKFGYETHTKEYEELLEQRVCQLIAHIKPTVFKLIKEYYEKYFYVNHMWVGKASTFEYYLKELVKTIGNNVNTKETLRKKTKDFKKGLQKRESLIKKLKISGKWRIFFDAFGDFMVTKIYRRFAQIYAIYKMEFIQKEIGRRLKLSLKQVRFMLPEEVKDALLNNSFNKQLLQKREKFCVYYAEKNRGEIFIGEKAEMLFKQTQRAEVEPVTELRGQIGCLGKARGIVKIIIRPNDMSKMRQGDILVSIATDPDIVPAMKKSAAIITEQGGVTSHAAIVSRELNIPCVIGTKIATRVLKDGDLVEVDANKGIVKIINKA